MDSMVVSIYPEWWKKNVIKVNMFAIFLMQYMRCSTIFLIKMKISNYRSKIAPIRISCCPPALNFNKLI